MKLTLLYTTACLLATLLPAAAKPIKVYILAGQSNMEGHAQVSTFDYIGDDPRTAPLLKEMRSADGKYTVADHVWISYYTGGERSGMGEGFGKLTAGYGSRTNPTQDGGNIGPEFTFGLALDKVSKDPVLLIKTAWGGKSLYYDFRPPSAGVFPRSAADIAKDKLPEADSGKYYRLMMEHVKRVLGDIHRVVPSHDNKQGYELCGFIWLQGFNDMVNKNVYANGDFSTYTTNLGHLIRDVRSELKAPKLPFVIGVLGTGGPDEKNVGNLAFRKAMAATAEMPEFKHSVTNVMLADYWDKPLGLIQDKKEKVRQMAYDVKNKSRNGPNADGSMDEAKQREYMKDFEIKLISPAEATMLKRGASNQGYHYLGCAKTFALIGQTFATKILALDQAAGLGK